MIKAIFARLWAIWGMISFIATFLIIFLPSMIAYLFKDPFAAKYFTAVAKIWMRVWLFLVACPLKIIGKENFKKDKAYIVTCNHNSLMDVPLSSPFIPGANKTIAKTSFSKIPLFGWFYAKGSVLVDRDKEISRRKSYDEMKKVLRLGMHMCIYPEGTRNRSNETLKKFYDGAFKLSRDTGVSVIPTLIFNTKKALPVHKSLYFLPTRLEIHFLEAVDPKGKTAEELKNMVYERMGKYYVAHSAI